MAENPTAAELVERAFGVARQSGKEDWWQMAVPVLKNRLLQMTKRTFKETDFGTASFRGFLNSIPDTIRVEDTPPPGFVILKSAAPDGWQPIAASRSRGERIRPDLWRAVLDYSSGRKYIWDVSKEAARPALLEEEGLIVPTVSAAELDEWRHEFAGMHNSSAPQDTKAVETWSQNRLPTVSLPVTLRPVWNNYMKKKVEQRLQDWFEANSIKMPLIEERTESAKSDVHAEALRELIHDCVRVMSTKELLDLRISPSTVMRVIQMHKSRDQNER
jgi:hypothetical protein